MTKLEKCISNLSEARDLYVRVAQLSANISRAQQDALEGTAWGAQPWPPRRKRGSSDCRAPKTVTNSPGSSPSDFHARALKFRELVKLVRAAEQNADQHANIGEHLAAAERNVDLYEMMDFTEASNRHITGLVRRAAEFVRMRSKKYWLVVSEVIADRVPDEIMSLAVAAGLAATRGGSNRPVEPDEVRQAALNVLAEFEMDDADLNRHGLYLNS